MFEVWVFKPIDGMIVRGVEFSDIENAKQFIETCKLIHGANNIELINPRGDTIWESYKVDGIWN